jgi:hypothetical protein
MRQLLCLAGLFILVWLPTTLIHAGDFTVTLDLTSCTGRNDCFYDVYVPIAAGDTVTVHFDCTGPDGIDPYLYVYDPNEDFVIFADDEGVNDCAGYNDAIATFTAAQTGTYLIEAATYGGAAGFGILTVTGSSLAVLGSSPSPLAADGRLNPDPSAPVVVYCQDDNLDIYAVLSDSRGFLVIRENIEALRNMETPAENRLVAGSEDGTVRLYQLDTGEWQINAPLNGNPNGYVFFWRNCQQQNGGLSNVGISGPYQSESREGFPE